MSDTSIRRAYWLGVRDGLPFLIVIVPFGMLFGVVAAEAGWNLAEIVSMSILVIAGASQFTALQLMSENAPTLIVIGTSLAVNLRMAMYSASMSQHIGSAPLWQRALIAYFLVDQTYGASMNRLALQPRMTTPQKVAHFFGNVTPVCFPWYLSTYAGAVAGSAIPDALALDFAVPVTFIAIVAPGLGSLPHLVAAGVSVVVALLLAGLPYNLWLIVAAVAAMLAGAAVELWQERRVPR